MHSAKKISRQIIMLFRMLPLTYFYNVLMQNINFPLKICSCWIDGNSINTNAKVIQILTVSIVKIQNFCHIQVWISRLPIIALYVELKNSISMSFVKFWQIRDHLKLEVFLCLRLLGHSKKESFYILPVWDLHIK